ncbi:MAG: HNH endonuclease [Ruminococcaceae bacterium]|nr:HNH endonuclease [Oscillospiraceae bacterium]
MGFSEKVQAEALAACERRCCICHNFCGTKMALHHIVQRADGGDDSFDNCIPLCLNCHEDMGKPDPRHVTGKHYSERELRLHRDNWYESVRNARSGIKEVTKKDIEKLFADDEVVVLDGGTIGENNTVNIDGMTTALKELAKKLPRIEQSDNCFNTSDEDDLLPDGTSRKIEII